MSATRPLAGSPIWSTQEATPCSGIFAPDNRFTRSYQHNELDGASGDAVEVDWVSGACFVVRRSAFEEVGGFDEAYFMYAEDVDLCWRLGRHGWSVAYVPTAEVTHRQGVSTDHHPYRMIVEHHRSLLRFAGRSTRGWRRVLLPLVALGIADQGRSGLPGPDVRPMTGATLAPEPRL